MIYLCPVCNGKGLVPNGFYDVNIHDNYYSTNTSPETCRSCGGKGYINDEEKPVKIPGSNIYKYSY